MLTQDSKILPKTCVNGPENPPKWGESKWGKPLPTRSKPSETIQHEFRPHHDHQNAKNRRLADHFQTREVVTKRTCEHLSQTSSQKSQLIADRTSKSAYPQSMCILDTNWTSKQNKPAHPKRMKSLHSWVCTKSNMQKSAYCQTTIFPATLPKSKVKQLTPTLTTKAKKNQHEHQYSKPSAWNVALLISTSIRTSIRFSPINWRGKRHSWTQTE